MSNNKKDLLKNISGNAKASFKTKQSKQGSFMTVSTSIIILIVLVVNLVVGKLDINFDLTKDKLYSLSEQTTKLLDSLESDITLISLEESDSKNSAFRDILSKYESKSSKLKVEYIDPVVNPNVVKEYAKEGETLSPGTVIVKGGDKFKVINNMDMYEVDYEKQVITGIKVEQQVTGAIDYVTNDNLPTAFVLEGHNEAALEASVMEPLKSENYTVQNLNIMDGEQWKYKSSDVLVINAPQRDINSEEYDTLMKFFNAGGGALVIMDYLPEGLENFNKLFANYGIAIEPKIVVEGDPSKIYKMPTNIIPVIEAHDITSPIVSAKLPILVTASQGITINELNRSSLQVTRLLGTTDSAFAKSNAEFDTIEKESGDVDGPFNLAVAVSDKLDDEKLGSAKLVVIGSKQVADAQLITLTKGGNLDLVINSLNWLTERENSISIRSKRIAPEKIIINQNQFYSLAVVSVIILPSLFAISGILMWNKRRHL